MTLSGSSITISQSLLLIDSLKGIHPPFHTGLCHFFCEYSTHNIEEFVMPEISMRGSIVESKEGYFQQQVFFAQSADEVPHACFICI